MALDLLSCMKSFAAIAKHKGFAKAARHEHVSAPVLTKQIKWLEELLGKSLFNRTTRRLELTEAGEIYLTHVKKILEQVQEAKNVIENLDQEPHGELIVGMPAALKSIFFFKQFQRFLFKYPKITLRISNEYSPHALIDNSVDLVISSVNVYDKQFVKEKLFTSRRSVFASPDYLNKHGTPKRVADLKKHNCLINERISPHHEWEFADNQKVVVNGNYISDSGIDIIFAAVNSIGLLWMTEILVKEEVATGQLVEIKLDAEPAIIALYLYYLPANHNSNVRLLANCLLKTNVSIL